MEQQTPRIDDRTYWVANDEIWLTVLWSGSRTGDRKLVLPNEESVQVNIRIFYRSSRDSFCNLSGDSIFAGQLYSIDLQYNSSYAIKFISNQSTVVYNVYTLESPDAYAPEDTTINLMDHLIFIRDVTFSCLIFGCAGSVVAIQARSRG